MPYTLKQTPEWTLTGPTESEILQQRMLCNKQLEQIPAYGKEALAFAEKEVAEILKPYFANYRDITYQDENRPSVIFFTTLNKRIKVGVLIKNIDDNPHSQYIQAIQACGLLEHNKKSIAQLGKSERFFCGEIAIEDLAGLFATLGIEDVLAQEIRQFTAKEKSNLIRFHSVFIHRNIQKVIHQLTNGYTEKHIQQAAATIQSFFRGNRVRKTYLQYRTKEKVIKTSLASGNIDTAKTAMQDIEEIATKLSL